MQSTAQKTVAREVMVPGGEPTAVVYLNGFVIKTKPSQTQLQSHGSLVGQGKRATLVRRDRPTVFTDSNKTTGFGETLILPAGISNGKEAHSVTL